ncbi:MAG: very short patch repair endonuclease [Cellulomonas sp.]|nr:very short patch repair endonuclease [Cellulomonas sp.]MCR6647298.1 very short patch repair endonuclease [Cellulomonas sp.]
MGASVSWASSPSVSAVMRGNRGRDTGPELAVRRELHRRGLRYRVNVRPLARLRRTVDVAFTRQRVVVLIDGCWWHGCPEHHRPARTNSDFWSLKIAGNVARDRDTDEQLRAAGWMVLRFWEHEPVGDVADAVERVVRPTG